MLAKEEAAHVRRAFRSLPARRQAALWHSAAEGHQTSFMAPLLDLSPSGVTSLVARARNWLRVTHLYEQMQGEGASGERRPLRFPAVKAR